MHSQAGVASVEPVSASGLSRRQLLQRAVAAGSGAALGDLLLPARYLSSAHGAAAAAQKPVVISNPLAVFPTATGSASTATCSPRTTRSSSSARPTTRTTASCARTSKNGVVVRIGPTYGYGKATDLDGNQASHRWDPRICQKGLALARRFYGDRRVKAPMVRAGFKEWVDAGFPRDEDGTPADGHVDARRGRAGCRSPGTRRPTSPRRRSSNIAETYTGEDGEEAARAQGYEPAMIEAMHERRHAGAQVPRRHAAARRHARLRHLPHRQHAGAARPQAPPAAPPEEIVGSRGFDNYSWHTDLPPGHPMVTGQQTVEFDLFAVEHAKLVVAAGA